jgi:hypothetical protein
MRGALVAFARMGVWVLAGALAFNCAGCAGASVSVTAVDARYPVSMSPVIRDATGRLHDQRSLQKRGTLTAKRTSLGFLYSTFAVRRSFDISNEINAQVSSVAGEAVVDLTVSVGSGCDLLNGFPLVGILPFWPGCVPVTVTGTIVSREVR